MIHPDTELRFISDEIGYGVVATKDIPKGTVTWALDKLDREFTPDEIEELGPDYREIINKYCFRNNKGHFILCWDISRFVNHSFNSNCITTAYDFEIAVRDIKAGEELTDDYGYLNITEPFRANNEGSRRKIVYPDDLLRYHRHWDKKLLMALRSVKRVSQPLQHLIDDDLWRKVLAISEGREEMDSILKCYCSDDSTAALRRTARRSRDRASLAAF